MLTLFGNQETENRVVEFLSASSQKISILENPSTHGGDLVSAAALISFHDKILESMDRETLSDEECEIIQACDALYAIFVELGRWEGKIKKLRGSYAKQLKAMKSLRIYKLDPNFMEECLTRELRNTDSNKVFYTLDEDLLQEMIRYHIAVKDKSKYKFPERRHPGKDLHDMLISSVRFIKILEELKDQLPTISILYDGINENLVKGKNKYKELLAAQGHG